MDWNRIIELVFSFAAGGGILVILTLKYSRKKAKTDAFNDLQNFWQESNKAIRTEFETRTGELEKRIIELEQNVCYRPNCKIRIQ